jgi:carbon monoxide dehydrogenase subunit G
MRIAGKHELPCTVDMAWTGLTSLEVLKACIPGCESVEREENDVFLMSTALSIGPVKARFTGTLKLTEQDPPHSTNLSFDGKGGVAGFGRGTARIVLTPTSDGCSMAYDAEAHVGGKLAQIGSRLVEATASQLAATFFERFAKQLSTVPAAESSKEVAASTASQFEVNIRWTARKILGATAVFALLVGILLVLLN